MNINSNEKCPVCGGSFTENDDVVICPYCGTPHHRECYNSLGHCYNAGKHNTDFEYSSAEAENDETSACEEQHADKDDNYAPFENQYNTSAQEISKTNCPQCGAEINKDAPFCYQCGARQSNPQYREYSPLNSFEINSQEQNRYEGDAQTIDGKKISDVAKVVRTNTDKFIPKFIKNKKISWNWSAFVFGPYYLMFRKMYVQGAVFMAVNLIIQLVVSGVFYKELAEYNSFVNANAQIFSSPDFYTNPDMQIVTRFMQIFETVKPALLIVFAAIIIIHLIIALFSDIFYKAKVMSILNKVDTNLENGGFFDSAIPMADGNSFSQSEMRTIYLGKMGGTSIFAPIIAWIALDLITTLISRI